MNQGGGSSYSNSFCASWASFKIRDWASPSPSSFAIFALSTRSAILRRLLVGLLPHDRYAAHAAASGDTLTAFAEVYTEARTKPEDVGLTATLTRARGGRVRSDTATRVRSEPGVAGYTAVIPLAMLAPGDYVLTLEARAGRRTVTRQVPFAVVE